jgi:hypothetical protein
MVLANRECKPSMPLIVSCEKGCELREYHAQLFAQVVTATLDVRVPARQLSAGKNFRN